MQCLFLFYNCNSYILVGVTKNDDMGIKIIGII